MHAPFIPSRPSACSPPIAAKSHTETPNEGAGSFPHFWRTSDKQVRHSCCHRRGGNPGGSAPRWWGRRASAGAIREGVAIECSGRRFGASGRRAHTDPERAPSPVVQCLCCFTSSMKGRWPHISWGKCSAGLAGPSSAPPAHATEGQPGLPAAPMSTTLARPPRRRAAHPIRRSGCRPRSLSWPLRWECAAARPFEWLGHARRWKGAAHLVARRFWCARLDRRD